MRFFTPEEFACKCGRAECDAPKEIVPELAEKLDVLRLMMGRPVRVNSGIRCAARNEAVGGKPDSEHLTGEGADLKVSGSREMFEMYDCARSAGFRRIGVAKTFLHVGVSARHDQDVTWIY